MERINLQLRLLQIDTDADEHLMLTANYGCILGVALYRMVVVGGFNDEGWVERYAQGILGAAHDVEGKKRPKG